jgi:hypothetical protein
MLCASPRVMAVLRAARQLALPDPLLFSGAVYQTAWNALTGRAPDHGIKDYDLGLYDPDTSWEAEDAWIRRTAAALPPPLDALVEVRNQARVHLWFASRFGEDEPYAPLGSTAEALERFLCPAFAVGARLRDDGAVEIVAPFGLDDVFALRLRPNPRRSRRAEAFARVAASARARWPELTVEES